MSRWKEALVVAGVTALAGLFVVALRADMRRDDRRCSVLLAVARTPTDTIRLLGVYPRCASVLTARTTP